MMAVVIAVTVLMIVAALVATVVVLFRAVRVHLLHFTHLRCTAQSRLFNLSGQFDTSEASRH